MTRVFDVTTTERFALLYQMFGVGAQIASQRSARSAADVRAEVRVLDALEAVSVADASADSQVLPGRSIAGAVSISLSQPDHDLLGRYLEAAAPAWHVARARECVAVLDLVSAAARVE
jgi:hypothetical protein